MREKLTTSWRAMSLIWHFWKILQWENECNSLIFNGTPYRARTCDLRLRRPLLYPTELRAHWDAATGGCGLGLYGQRVLSQCLFIGLRQLRCLMAIFRPCGIAIPPLIIAISPSGLSILPCRRHQSPYVMAAKTPQISQV